MTILVQEEPSVTIKYSVWIAEYRNSRKFEQWTRSDTESSAAFYFLMISPCFVLRKLKADIIFPISNYS